MPTLTPEQADLLWTFIQELASTLWEAYEPQLSDVAAQELVLELHHPHDSTIVSDDTSDLPPW